jgi:vacuolar-type H+-ATPase subunit H
MTEIGHRDLSRVERGVEEALRNFAGNGANGGGEVPGLTAAERIDRIGNISALAIMEASETTAKDIEAAAQAAVDIAADITEEARQLAAELGANGKKMSERLKEFAALANRVSTAMRNTRAEVLNPSETPSSIRGLDDAGGAQPT